MTICSQFCLITVKSSTKIERFNRPFAGSGHMVRNKLRWDANDAVGLPKQRNSYQSSQTFLCTMWPDPAKGLFWLNKMVDNFVILASYYESLKVFFKFSLVSQSHHKNIIVCYIKENRGWTSKRIVAENQQIQTSNLLITSSRCQHRGTSFSLHAMSSFLDLQQDDQFYIQTKSSHPLQT